MEIITLKYQLEYYVKNSVVFMQNNLTFNINNHNNVFLKNFVPSKFIIFVIALKMMELITLKYQLEYYVNNSVDFLKNNLTFNINNHNNVFLMNFFPSKLLIFVIGLKMLLFIQWKLYLDLYDYS